MKKDPLIQVKGVTKRFGALNPIHQDSCALRNINLEVFSGAIYGIIGMSGAGKSTLLRCLTGLDQPSEGSILIQGEEISQKSKKDLGFIRQDMGMVFQHFQLFSSRTVARNITYPMEIHGKSQKEQSERVAELLPLVGLEGKQDHYPAQLSGGEKQRVGIARALANHPRILFCDEPTSALDSKTTHALLQLLQQLNQSLGLTIVIITHQLEVVKQICHRVAVLSKGEIVEEGEVRQVFTRPSHLVTQHLLHLSIEQLPAGLRMQRDPSKKLVRLGFQGNQAQEPVISQMVKKYKIDANILSGGLDYIQNTIIGHLIIELSGHPDELNQALQFLHHQHIHCEVLS